MFLSGHQVATKIEDTKRSKLTFGDFGQCYGRTLLILEVDGLSGELAVTESILHAGEQVRADEDGIAGSDANRIGTRNSQRRDAVQRGRKGPQIPKSGGTMHKRGQGIQSDRVFFAPGAQPGAAQGGNMAQSAQSQGNIAHPGPDVSAFATTDFELRLVRAGGQEPGPGGTPSSLGGRAPSTAANTQAVRADGVLEGAWRCRP